MPVRKNNGFTLIELLITLSIVGILALSAIGFSSIVDRSRATSAAQSLARSTQLAKSYAINRATRITLCASNDFVNCEGQGENLSLIIFQDSNQSYTRDPSEIMLAQIKIDGILSWNGAHQILRYRPDGTAIEFGTFTYCLASKDNRFARQLTINAAGRGYLSRDRDGDGKDDANTGTGDIICPSV